jgi:hypothetical protein
LCASDSVCIGYQVAGRQIEFFMSEVDCVRLRYPLRVWGLFNFSALFLLYGKSGKLLIVSKTTKGNERQQLRSLDFN